MRMHLFDLHARSSEAATLKFIFLANLSWNIHNYRLPLINALRDSGHEVVLLAPRDEYTAQLVQAGFRWQDVPLSQRGINPFTELRSIFRIYRFYRRERPDVVQHFTPKCVIYGSIAARLAGVKKIVNTITGLGYAFSGEFIGKQVLQLLVRFLYRLALANTTVLFQNADDMRNLSNGRAGTSNFFLLAGSGVNLAKFARTPEPEGMPVVILPARLIEEKGVLYFIETARVLKQRGAQARFVLVGAPDAARRDSLTTARLRQWVSEGVIEWWGWRDDMENVYPQSHIVCLPTYYGEGVPKSLIEAAACARPIVATDIPGCREVVRSGENGILVPVKDTQALVDAIAKLLEDPELRRQMGARSREIAERDFYMRRNSSQYFSAYGMSL